MDLLPRPVPLVVLGASGPQNSTIVSYGAESLANPSPACGR